MRRSTKLLTAVVMVAGCSASGDSKYDTSFESAELHTDPLGSIEQELLGMRGYGWNANQLSGSSCVTESSNHLCMLPPDKTVTVKLGSGWSVEEATAATELIDLITSVANTQMQSNGWVFQRVDSGIADLTVNQLAFGPAVGDPPPDSRVMFTYVDLTCLNADPDDLPEAFEHEARFRRCFEHSVNIDYGKISVWENEVPGVTG